MYIHSIFEWNKVKSNANKERNRNFNSDKKRTASIEEYINSFIICIGNLCFKNKVSKRCFAQLNMMEYFLSLWNQINEIDFQVSFRRHEVFDLVSTELVEVLKLSIVSALGKILNRNDQLKQIYLYSYKEDMTTNLNVTKETTSADWFLKELISWLVLTLCLI